MTELVSPVLTQTCTHFMQEHAIVSFANERARGNFQQPELHKYLVEQQRTTATVVCALEQVVPGSQRELLHSSGASAVIEIGC